MTYDLEPHQVYNEFDKQGLLIGLPRLPNERNKDYKKRLLNTYIDRANSTYRGLINGITRELGLTLSKVITISPVSVMTAPVIIFSETKCILYSDFPNTKILTIDRYDRDGGSFTIAELISTINADGNFLAVVASGIDTSKRSMTIYNQSSVEGVPAENIEGRGSTIKLENENLIDDTISLISDNLTERVFSLANLIASNQYYIDITTGTISTLTIPSINSYISYSYLGTSFDVWNSPIIIHNLQSADFRTKMFEVIDSETLGRPTDLGASIINELLSVFPSNWGI